MLLTALIEYTHKNVKGVQHTLAHMEMLITKALQNAEAWLISCHLDGIVHGDRDKRLENTEPRMAMGRCARRHSERQQWVQDWGAVWSGEGRDDQEVICHSLLAERLAFVANVICYPWAPFGTH